MTRYQIREESGTDTVVEADDLDEAIALAEEWIAGGDYGERSCYVDVWVLDLDDPDAVEYGCQVTWTNEPDPPACVDGTTEHDWQHPEWLGGCSENPGVWSLGGSQISSVAVCADCGAYQRYVSETTPGQHPAEPEQTTYEEADERSLRWCGELLWDRVRCGKSLDELREVLDGRREIWDEVSERAREQVLDDYRAGEVPSEVREHYDGLIAWDTTSDDPAQRWYVYWSCEHSHLTDVPDVWACCLTSEAELLS